MTTTVLTFGQMQDAAEAIAAQTVNADVTPNFRHTLLLVFEEVSRNMPQEKVHDGIWNSSFEIRLGDLTTEPYGPIIPGSLAVNVNGFDLDTLKVDLFHGTFEPEGGISEDLVITGNRTLNAVTLPIDQQNTLLRVENIQIFRGSNLLIGEANYTRIDEWDNLLFLYSGGQGGPAFDLQDGDRYRIWYETEWAPALTDGLPTEWPDEFPDRIKENVLQGYVAHILLQQAAAAQASALKALKANEDSYTGDSADSLNSVLGALNDLLAEDTTIDPHVVPAVPDIMAAVVAALPDVTPDAIANTIVTPLPVIARPILDDILVPDVLPIVAPAVLTDVVIPAVPAISVHVVEANPFFNANGDLDSPIDAPDFVANPNYTIDEQPAGIEDFPAVAVPSLTAIYASLTAARNSIADLAALADLPDNTALEAYIQTGNFSVWSRLTDIRTDLEGDTDLDPDNPDRVDKTAWERFDQCLQDALSSLHSGYVNNLGVQNGLIPRSIIAINSSPNIANSPLSYLALGDDLINNVNIGSKASEIYTQYSQASLAIGRAVVEAAATQNQHALGLTNLALAHAQKIEQYLGYARIVLSEWENLSAYLQARASAVVQNNQAVVARGQGQAQVGLTKVNAIVEEIRARISSTELSVRIGQLAIDDRRSAREVHGRVQEVKGFLQTQNWQTQSQAYGAILQAVSGAYRSRIEVAGPAHSVELQVAAQSYDTNTRSLVQAFDSKTGATAQTYGAKTQAESSNYGSRIAASSQIANTRTQARSQLDITKMQAESANYGSRIAASAQVFNARTQAAAQLSATKLQAESDNYGSKNQAEASGYSAKVGGEIQAYSSRIAAEVQAFVTTTQTKAQIFLSKLQVSGQKLENIVEAMLRRNEISNQYREIADRYQQEGQARHDIYIRDLRDKANAIRRRSRG